MKGLSILKFLLTGILIMAVTCHMNKKIKPTDQIKVLQTTLTCEICKAVKQKLIEPLDLIDKNIDFIKTLVCPIVGIKSHLSTKECHGLVDSLEPAIFMNLMRLLVGREDMICGIALNICDSPDLKLFDLKGWIANTLKGTPSQSTKKEPAGKKGTYTLLHVNDMHMDPLYTEGGETKCHNT